MAQATRTVALLWIVCLLIPVPARADQTIEGEWVGGFRGRGDWVFVRARFSDDGKSQTGSIDLPQFGERALALVGVRRNGQQVRFTLPGMRDDLLFTGEWKEGRIRGSVRQGSGWGQFELLPLCPPEPRMFEGVPGTYEVAPGRVVLISAAGGALNYVDYETDRMGPLYPVSPTRFISGPSVLAGYPVELTVTFAPDPNGGPMTMTWERKGEPVRRAVKRVIYRTESVTYGSTGARIGAWLLVPNRPGPHPALVMIHGSGAVSRASLLPFADAFARSGVAVLVPDKRGVGESEGNWLRATFDDLASDALAGVEFLKGRPEIDPNQIGLLGSSLGGWVAPLAASRSSDVRFIIAEAAPAQRPLEHELLRVERQMEADGFPEPLVDRAVSFMRRKFKVAETGRGWDDVVRMMEQGEREGWITYVNPPSTLESLQWNWNHILTFDPVPVLERVRCPVLVLYGELDTITPADLNRGAMERALRRAGNPDVTVSVIPGANHSFFSAVTGGPRETPSLKGFVPGFFASRVDWVLARVDEAQDEPAPTQSPAADGASLALPMSTP